MNMSESFKKVLNTAEQYYDLIYSKCGDKNEAYNEALKTCLNFIDEEEKEELKEQLKKLTINMSIDEAHILEVESKPWLDDYKETIEWQHWDRYKRYLRKKNWPLKVVDSIESTTYKILDKLGNPQIEGAFDIRGLVVGDVQSGKTANYTGLINRALDVNYKIIIVLSGMHNNLRVQTQKRLNKEVVGFQYTKVKDKMIPSGKIGVRTLPGGDFPCAGMMTTADDDGDFKKNISHYKLTDHEKQPFIFVVKKNKSILDNLIKYFKEVNKAIGKNIPVLIIDDEADQASINTESNVDDEGNLIDDNYLSTINQKIREILELFNRKSYVGYTATPFANVLIHNDACHKDYGYDLFPKDFIINLPTPPNYTGAMRLFGPEDSIECIAIKEIKDDEYNQLIPKKQRKNKNYQPKFINESLKRAIKAFIISTAVRRIRGMDDEHNSMLIHVTLYTEVQEKIAELVYDEVEFIKLRLKNGDGNAETKIIEEFKKIWEIDFDNKGIEFPNKIEDWKDIETELFAVAKSIEIKTINGKSEDVLDYDNKSKTLNVIAIGGNCLSRGLTLEGLTISYYLRESKMYDTLMQMARWFGYREGYEDLCKIYTTKTLIDWFRHIALATEALKEEFKVMEIYHLTPRDFGLRIRSHKIMKATSPMKSRNSEKISLSFDGKLNETTVLPLDNNILRYNFEVTNKLIGKLDMREFKSEKRKNNILWHDVNGQTIVNYLNEYKSAESAVKINSKLLAKYIITQMQKDELENWTVALISLEKGDKAVTIAGHHIYCASRTKGNGRKDNNIGKLVSEAHKLLYFSNDELLTFKEQGYSEMQIKQKFDKRGIHKGLLLIYPLSNKEFEVDEIPIAISVVLPKSSTADTTEYIVNNVYLENLKLNDIEDEEYGLL